MNTSVLRTRLKSAVLPALAAAGLLFAGCDSSTGPGLTGDARFEGRVTDDVGFGKAAGEIEGAVVTAANVSANGSTDRLTGDATTDAEGRFVLSVEDVANEVILTAEKGDFRSRVMAYTDGRARVDVIPMSVETHGEASVFVEARRQDDENEVTMADVAVYVTQEVAAEVLANPDAAAKIAAAIAAEAKTKKSYAREERGGEEVQEARDRENQAFMSFQSQVSVSADASAQSEALEALEQALVRAYTESGIEVDEQARARQAALAAMVRFSGDLSSNTRLHLRKKAEILAAMAASQALGASFRAAGATDARLSALEQAESTLLAGLRAATSMNALAEAKADFEADVRSELAAEIGLDANVLESAEAALATARTTLELALSSAASAQAIAAAHASFYAAAEAAVRTSLPNSDGAELAAYVLTLLSADVE